MVGLGDGMCGREMHNDIFRLALKARARGGVTITKAPIYQRSRVVCKNQEFCTKTRPLITLSVSGA
jgi:hypothetical protein